MILELQAAKRSLKVHCSEKCKLPFENLVFWCSVLRWLIAALYFIAEAVLAAGFWRALLARVSWLFS